jgi:L-methionine (R)-S-oxide reductase
MQQAIETEMLIAQGCALIDGERDGIANAANLSALVFEALPDVNWAGIYLLRAGELVLGPFQGKPACTRIELGKGVCGTAAAERRTIVVPDVHAFAGHIACDSASRSEIVVPLILQGGALVGVFDVDSPLEDRFHDGERRLVEAFAQLLVSGSDFR